MHSNPNTCSPPKMNYNLVKNEIVVNIIHSFTIAISQFTPWTVISRKNEKKTNRLLNEKIVKFCLIPGILRRMSTIFSHLVRCVTKRSQHNELLDFNSLNVLIKFSQKLGQKGRDRCLYNSFSQRIGIVNANPIHPNISPNPTHSLPLCPND